MSTINQKEKLEQRTSKIESGINSNNQFFSLFMQAHVGIAIFKGEELVIELANDALLKIWGKTKDVIGKALLQALPEISGTDYPDLLKDVIKKGVTQYANENSAYLIRDGKKEEVFFNFVYQPFYEVDGTISGVMAIANEVTDQVVARKKVEESESRFRNLVEQAIVATGVYEGEDMVIRMANDAMLKVWGKDKSVIGKTLKEALPELDGQPFLQLLNNVYTTGNTYNGREDVAHLVVDGRLQTFYFNYSYKALRNSEGKIYGILNMATDVTDSVIAKMQLMESEERLRIAVESVGMGTWDYNPVTNTIFCSPQTKELFGLNDDDNITLEIALQPIINADKQKVYNAIQAALNPSSGGKYHAEYALVNHHNQTERTIRAKGQVFFNAENKPYRFIGTALDITDQVKASQVLEQKIQERTRELKEANESLERSNRELEQFAHVASHDMKEPIRKVTFFTSRLQNEFGKDLGDKARTYLTKVHQSAERLTKMVEGVLDYSTINTTKQHFETIDLKETIRSIEADVELVIKEKKATITYNEIPPFEGASFLIYQLFYNLITNSLKFTKRDISPVIEIEGNYTTANAVSDETASDARWVEITIKDNGIGFNQDYAERIFESFTRLNAYSEFEGTGMGLALAKRIVQRHKGFISATSKVGEGACFKILFPEHQ
jgi:PAS domain S-box-containing protein